ncbi:ethanolamine ammonia-lyase subunit EutC [Collinsella ihumii]|uniref:Ethanolamine ammonia-lyase small subunit n=1 Tax=Collinsella ihumii TaxID=1720204 RepID=A0AAW7K033_9ACTN|nr:ethanolamine ammonia-lyase subunit EutC [Collinsella ihumii]MBM6687583.1 ethanolamine ammonia-lyase subunit EutC [Collinsella tanakaei]MBM6777804.1 ethanolamine ammonia-lyase subunit EutC [Collinsella tanakaei]MDN0070100.1 ethanolamine ammonia-lyase subunit EutC [Collinsella ihumii]
MVDEKLVASITRAVLEQIGSAGVTGACCAPVAHRGDAGSLVQNGELIDLRTQENKTAITLEHAQNMDMVEQMRKMTPARIGVGSAGPRLRTRTYLTLRADHAGARDAVFRDVDEDLLARMGLFTVQTLCSDRNEHLTRPDLGRQLSEETKRELRSKCQMSPQVQVYVADGLSSQAIDANIEDFLPALMDGLQDLGIQTGTPFFMRYGRVPAMDVVSETLDAEVTMVLVGERPGLVTANSMSAYIAYRAKVGMPEGRRTVVSNIHSGGIPAPEAGAHVAQLIKTILEARTSGVDLQR